MRLKPTSRRGPTITLASLVDVIFLLLLYFVLSSTFTRFGEVELVSGRGGTGGAASAAPVLFLQLGPESLALNGAPVTAETLAESVAALMPEGGAVQAVMALRDGVNAQAMTDILLILRGIPGVGVTVIG